ncbi:DeoR family transcriptional regulator [Ketogulonicigenium robustum]|uniref:DeoR family transcriptional regulator n=1 Tax=Ketogulonicigenium robustum TaxID=92947 RepID=A0A1W6P164_9RHOB|nr:sugar-binding transcriptional regulator [Ketogulonicigenium robustum]ARO15258.1 DeoR family transcriptional regulator [Ketogulonicigenium robustum]
MDANELMARAAWLYHMEGLTQAQIADALGVTRRRVNEVLAAALREGFVKISFSGKIGECAGLERDLCARYGLDAALVVPTPVDPAQMHSVLGRAIADWMDRFIVVNDIQTMGVGWGSTLRETVQAMSPAARPQMQIRSVMGGLTHGSEINTFEIVRGFANVFGAACEYLVAPIYADSARSRDLIIAQDVFRKTFETICTVDMAYLSIGDISGRSLQVRYGLPAGVTREDLLAAGAVGEVAGHFLNTAGQPIDHPINAQVFSPALDRFKHIRHRILAGGGAYKLEAVRAILAGGLASVLVTDSENATNLLV